MIAPAGTPRPVIERLNTDARQDPHGPDMKEKFDTPKRRDRREHPGYFGELIKAESASGARSSARKTSGSNRDAVASITLESVITCPRCGTRSGAHARGRLPVVYECGACRSLLKPKAGDCCVFCSYGSVPVPARQSAVR